MSWNVIVPTIRYEQMKKFLTAWNSYFKKHNVSLFVIEDGEPTEEMRELLAEPREYEVTHLLSKDAPDFIPKKTDMCRSWAFYKAYQANDKPYFLTLDDDVVSYVDVFTEYEKVFSEGAPLSEYLDVGALTTSGLQMRGFPYKDRKKATVAVQYGGWHNVLDYDAATQLSTPKKSEFFKDVVVPVPKGVAATCCIMNCAWQRRYTPIMWQLPMLDGRYNRVGDIWSGLFIKKTLDAIGAVMVINGKASVWHERASDPYNSLVKEAPSVWLNDNLWEQPKFGYGGEGVLEEYKLVVNGAYMFFVKHDKDYAEHFLSCAKQWLKLWE